MNPSLERIPVARGAKPPREPFLLRIGRVKHPVSEKTARILHDRCGFPFAGECSSEQCKIPGGFVLHGAELGYKIVLKALLFHPSNPLETGRDTLKLLAQLLRKEKSDATD